MTEGDFFYEPAATIEGQEYPAQWGYVTYAPTIDGTRVFFVRLFSDENVDRAFYSWRRISDRGWLRFADPARLYKHIAKQEGTIYSSVEGWIKDSTPYELQDHLLENKDVVASSRAFSRLWNGPEMPPLEPPPDGGVEEDSPCSVCGSHPKRCEQPPVVYQRL